MEIVFGLFLILIKSPKSFFFFFARQTLLFAVYITGGRSPLGITLWFADYCFEDSSLASGDGYFDCLN